MLTDFSTILYFTEQNGIQYNLDDQVKHKINFCREVVDKNEIGEVYLVGHSIGALICLRLNLKAYSLFFASCF